MSRPASIALMVVAIVAVGAGAFYGGMRYGQQSALSDLRSSFQPGSAAVQFGDGGQNRLGQNGQPGQFAQRGATGANGFTGSGVFGTIESIDGDTMVISTGDGQKTTVKTTDTTLIEKNASVSISELAQGETVVVSGSKNDDGSLTARSVQVAPTGRIGGSGAGSGN